MIVGVSKALGGRAQVELVLIGVGIWVALVVVAIAMCRVASRADARAEGLYASERQAAIAPSEEAARPGIGIRIPAL
jgi:hypothetical protein